mgnify:CR=1 FL=1
MTLQLKFFVVPIRSMEVTEAELNRFLRSVRVINTRREFVSQGGNSFWSLAVEYWDGADSHMVSRGDVKKRTRIDYREVLSPEDFAIYAKLREWRQKRASQDAVPVYTIFTNEQLALIAEKKMTTKAALQQIDGIGDARIKKYGDEVIKVIS